MIARRGYFHTKAPWKVLTFWASLVLCAPLQAKTFKIFYVPDCLVGVPESRWEIVFEMLREECDAVTDLTKLKRVPSEWLKKMELLEREIYSLLKAVPEMRRNLPIGVAVFGINLLTTQASSETVFLALSAFKDIGVIRHELAHVAIRGLESKQANVGVFIDELMANTYALSQVEGEGFIRRPEIGLIASRVNISQRGEVGRLVKRLKSFHSPSAVVLERNVAAAVLNDTVLSPYAIGEVVHSMLAEFSELHQKENVFKLFFQVETKVLRDPKNYDLLKNDARTRVPALERLFDEFEKNLTSKQIETLRALRTKYLLDPNRLTSFEAEMGYHH